MQRDAKVSGCLAMLATELFGDAAGTWLGGLLWMVAGSVSCGVGYRLLKA
ncbi:MAG: hypothetical protein GXC94_14555 [Comamonadaceae bacterium]|nr:hypothetical protein [Comamonadaceae bacterium]